MYVTYIYVMEAEFIFIFLQAVSWGGENCGFAPCDDCFTKEIFT